MPSPMIRSEQTRTVPRLPARKFNYATYQSNCHKLDGESQGGRDYLEIGEEAEICRNFVRRRSERSQWGEDINVDLARIRLRRDWVRVRETRHLCNQSIEFLHLFIVGVIKRQKGIPCRTWRTLSWSPSNSARKLACVPVVPLTPRKPRSSRARFILRRSQSSSLEVTKYR